MHGEQQTEHLFYKITITFAIQLKQKNSNNIVNINITKTVAVNLKHI